MASKRKSTIKAAYIKERKRIQRQTNRMKKRGYEFSTDPLPPIPKRITAASVRRLKQITTKKLYEAAQYVDKTWGEILPGRKGRARERKKTAEKISATLKQKAKWKKDLEDLIKKHRTESEDEYQAQKKRRQKQEEEDKRRLTTDESFQSSFEPWRIAKINVENRFSEVELDFPRTTAKLKAAFSAAEQREGVKEFWTRISEVPDFMTTFDDIFYKAGDHISPLAFNRVMAIINNRASTAQEAKDMQDTFETDAASFDFDPDERF